LKISRDNDADRAIRLQRILIILGYMTEEDFFISNAELQWWDSDAHAEDPDGGLYREGYFAMKTLNAVKQFQNSVWAWNDGVVWDITKVTLYRTLFMSYHYAEVLSNNEIQEKVFRSA
jgi:rhamnogalacturonyl hydrolase YesR